MLVKKKIQPPTTKKTAKRKMDPLTNKSSTNTSTSDVPKTVIEHLEELRSIIIKISVICFTGWVACFYSAPYILKILKTPLLKILEQLDVSIDSVILLNSLHPTGSLMMAVKISLASGIILTLPVILYFIALFIMPALTSMEKKIIIFIFSAGAFLFVGGIIFCYFIALPISLKFLWKIGAWMNITNSWTLENYVSFTTGFLLAFGIIFEMPCVILLLVKLNILSRKTLINQRKIVIVIILIVSAFITPPDVITQIIMAIPLIALYEISVLGAYFIEKKAKNASKLAG